MNTGYVVADAEDDFRRMRRRAAWSRVVTRLRGRGGRGADLPVLTDAVAAWRLTGGHDRGVQIVELDTIVGTVGRPRDFDRRFRPRRSVDAQRWQRLDRADRNGEYLPPIEVYRVAGRHWVIDGHHRVSVASALGRTTIDAHVVEVPTAGDTAGRPLAAAER